MSATVRDANEHDLDAILQLTTANRRLLASLEPWFWRPSERADALHALWITHLVKSLETPTRVALDGETVAAFAVSNPQPQCWFVDDVCASDWAGAGVALLAGIPERPALACLARADEARVRAGEAAGLRRAGSYRALRLEAITGAASDQAARPPELAPPPAHTFPIPEEARVFVADAAGGYAVGSPPFAPPPIYDGGGPVCVIDRIIGEDREGLLLQMLRVARARGDAAAIVVVDEPDRELAAILDAFDARHPVDLYRWP